MLDLTHLRLDDPRCVGTIELDLDPSKQAYVFIGANGVGKTRLLNILDVNFQIDLKEKPPVVFIETQDRGHFEEATVKSDSLRNWIKESANLSSIFQKNKNNRQHYLFTLLKCLHEIDSKYDANYLELDDKDNITLKVNNEEKELSQLSTGFVSIFKILTKIISEYGAATNARDLQNVQGIVLIDEIESHLHLEWQVKIIPTLKKLFPNTTFFIATHSPLVLSQLEDGEAYELRRDADDVVRTYKIKNPGNTAMIDLLKVAFNIDLNRLALDRPITETQQKARMALLERMKSRKVAQ
ncbi:AAA family ATPase [Thiothrix winogradskyi]|uniref:AAA family ATPase n=1 Tax=Thiothrix winogradskyi TaxID=96472 RepID=A0ABY3T3V7_9GAMM|nr:AAA family ATPase [Thiothrix winogradskyi]UJS25436.1 AAA family ATPase [Thiothrix winogradskyi]